MVAISRGFVPYAISWEDARLHTRGSRGSGPAHGA